MQNKPNFRKTKINTYPFLQRTYENIRPFWPPKNEPKTKPNSERTKMNITSVKTRDYENKLVFEHQKNKAKSNPISTKSKNRCNLRLHKGLQKQYLFTARENKPNQTQFKGPAHTPGQRQEKNRSAHLLIKRTKTLHSAGDEQYYIRHICRCGSMVEHIFRKAGIDG